MLNVGLTGGIGAGKSEVTKRFAAHGATIIDADALAREVVAIGTPGLDAVIAEFGEEMRGPDGGLDRDKMAALVFSDDAARDRLNSVVHPLVGERVFELLDIAEREDPHGILVNDVPLIVEANVADRYEVIVVVDAPEEVQLDRLVNRRGMSEADARARMAKQASRDERCAIADYIIDNSGDLDALQQQVDNVWTELQARALAARSD